MLPLALLAGAFVAGGVATLSGFGIGSLLVPMLALRTGMRTAVLAVALPHVAATALRFWRLRRHVDRKVFLTFGLVNAAGALAGSLLRSRSGDLALTWVQAALLLFAGGVGLAGYTDRFRFGPKLAYVMGALSGTFGGLVGNQSGLRSAAMLGLRVERESFVATATATALLVDFVRIPVYFTTDHAGILTAWPLAAVVLAGVIPGTLAGERLLWRIPRHMFRRVVASLLIALALGLIATQAYVHSSR